MNDEQPEPVKRRPEDDAFLRLRQALRNTILYNKDVGERQLGLPGGEDVFPTENMYPPDLLDCWNFRFDEGIPMNMNAESEVMAEIGSVGISLPDEPLYLEMVLVRDGEWEAIVQIDLRHPEQTAAQYLTS